MFFDGSRCYTALKYTINIEGGLIWPRKDDDSAGNGINANSNK